MFLRLKNILKSFWRVEIIQRTTGVPLGCQWYLGNISHHQINIIYLEPFPMIDLIAASHTCTHSPRNTNPKELWTSKQISGNIQLRLNIVGASCIPWTDHCLLPQTSSPLVSGLQTQDTQSWVEERVPWILFSALLAPTSGSSIWEDSFNCLGQLYERDVLLAFEAYSHQNKLKEKVVIYI